MIQISFIFIQGFSKEYCFMLKSSSEKRILSNQTFEDRVSKVLIHTTKDEVVIETLACCLRYKLTWMEELN